MDFETAALATEVMHYILVLTPVAYFMVRTYKNFKLFVFKFYALFFLWGLACFLFQGCPITLFENWMSTKIYGKPFYPDYTFSGSDFYYLFTNFDFYIPLILFIIMEFVNYKADESTTGSIIPTVLKNKWRRTKQ